MTVTGYSRPPLAEETEWQLRGLCRYDPNPQKWTPDPTPDQPFVEFKSQEAIRICHQCPVEMTCRQWAFDHREEFGVWGGMSEDQRADLWRGRRYSRRHHRKIAEFYR